MRKAVSKRIKITSKGKMLYRKAGHNHFNAKKSRRVQRRQKRFASFPKATEKRMKQYL